MSGISILVDELNRQADEADATSIKLREAIALLSGMGAVKAVDEPKVYVHKALMKGFAKKPKKPKKGKRKYTKRSKFWSKKK